MKRPRLRPLAFALFLAASAALASGPAAGSPPSAPAPGPAPVVVRAAGGSKSITVTEKGGSLEILLPNGARLVGSPSGEKRKYRREPGGQQVCEVKPGDAGFKVRTTDGKLLWKVKVAEDKIKVSDNEENANPWSLKTKYEDKVKVVDASDNEIAEVRFYPDKTKVKGPDGTVLWECAARRSAAFGVLVLDRVPEEHRAILMAEILARRR